MCYKYRQTIKAVAQHINNYKMDYFFWTSVVIAGVATGMIKPEDRKCKRECDYRSGSMSYMEE